MEFTIAHPFVCLLAGELSPPLAHKLREARDHAWFALHPVSSAKHGAGLKVRVQSIFVEKNELGEVRNLLDLCYWMIRAPLG